MNFNECREAKQHLRRLERRWRSSGLEIDHQTFVHAAAKYNKTLLQARREYYSLELEDCGPREFFRKVDRLCQAKSTKNVINSSMGFINNINNINLNMEYNDLIHNAEGKFNVILLAAIYV